MSEKIQLGARGEQLAVEFLEKARYRIIDRNWRCRIGEIDIVALDGDTIVFVEVKTRSGLGYGHPFEAITAAKLARLRRLAAAWCDESAARSRRIRIDVIGILCEPGREPRIEHLKQVF